MFLDNILGRRFCAGTLRFALRLFDSSGYGGSLRLSRCPLCSGKFACSNHQLVVCSFRFGGFLLRFLKTK
jgi:hypothetical protein